MRILIVEDEAKLADVIASKLRNENYVVDVATDGESGLFNALTDSYDLIILDIMLPHVSGLEILKQTRAEGVSAKIIMLTARTAIDDKLEGLTGGANDYLTKPFHMDELVARVNILTRGVQGNDSGKYLLFGDIGLNHKNMNLNCVTTGETIALSKKEYQLLDYLLTNTGQILSKDQIYDRIWGFDSEIESNNLEAYLSFIRKKLKAIGSNVTIKAVRGVGYILENRDE